MATPRHIMIERVNFIWYLLPIVPILGLGYASLRNWLPSWVLILAVFAFVTWLSSLVFTLFAVIKRRRQQPGEPRQ